MKSFFILLTLALWPFVAMSAGRSSARGSFAPQTITDNSGQTWVANASGGLSPLCRTAPAVTRPWGANVNVPTATCVAGPGPATNPNSSASGSGTGAGPSGPSGLPTIPFNPSSGNSGPIYTNGSGPYGSSTYAPQSLSPVDMQSAVNAMRTYAPACGAGENGTDMWKSTTSVMSEGIIPPGQGKSLNAPSHPRLEGSDGHLTVSFGPSKMSHCSSATMAAFFKHIADLSNSGQLHLSQAEINFLNGPKILNALYGDTYAYAVLNQALGGQNMRGEGSQIPSVLANARPGDVLKFDRNNGQGHSTVFKDIEGGKVCFWSSNQVNNGVGVNCEAMSSLKDVVVSRFPTDIAGIAGRLDKLSGDGNALKWFSSANTTIPASAIQFSSTLSCDMAPTGSGEPEGTAK